MDALTHALVDPAKLEFQVASHGPGTLLPAKNKSKKLGTKHVFSNNWSIFILVNFVNNWLWNLFLKNIHCAPSKIYLILFENNISDSV